MDNMILDDEYEAHVTPQARIDALGFKPQKENMTNHILPYADELDEESGRFLEQVKTNLAKAVMLREMKPACGVWSSRLMKYIRIYGLKFSKEDHIALCKLAYELVLIPDLEPCKVHKFATLFIMLTKKRYLISPEELMLPWRPLYELGKKLFVKNSTHIGLYHYLTPEIPDALDRIRQFFSGNLAEVLETFSDNEDSELPKSLAGSFLSMVKCARPYFEVSATKEILAEFLPQINLWSSECQLLNMLAMFLPVGLKPEFAAQGHELWFDQLMNLWYTCYNSQCGVPDLMIIFAGLAKRNPGAVDWTPHVPKMFMRFLHALNLPVSYKDIQYGRNHSIDAKYVASWIVWSIRPDGVVLKHLRSLLAGVESYLHSANAGRWSFKLKDSLRKLAREFLNRVRRERDSHFKNTWENQVPEHLRLRDEDITEFVNIVLEPTIQTVYSRSGSLDVSIALQNLATLRPAIVIPPLLEKLRTSLTSLTEPHRVTASISAVASVARPMLRGPVAGYPEGPTHVVPFLIAVLPGLDPNDLKKTLVSLHFILVFSWMVPYIDCSSAHEHWPDLTEEELLTCESTAQFEDFVLVFLDRLFIIINSSVHEQPRLDTKENDCVRSKVDTVIEKSISSAAMAVLMQCSPKIFSEALRKFKNFATESTFEPNVSGSMIGVLLRCFSRVDSEATLAAFLPQLIEELNELLSTDEILTEENPPRDLIYRLVLLRYLVKCDGTALLKYIPSLLPILDRILKIHATFALSKSCDILSYILLSLCSVDLKEWRSSPNNYSEAPQKWLPIREWGRGCLLKDTNFEWHIPNEDEAACAQMLSDRYLKKEVLRLRQWLSGERPMCRERRLRSLYIIKAVLACSTFLPPPDEEPVILMNSQVPATSLPFTNGVRHAVTLDGVNMRVAITNLLLDVQARLLADKSDDTRGLEMLIHVWECVVVLKCSRTGAGLEARLRTYGALERSLDGRRGVAGDAAGAARLRTLLADAARLQDESRIDLVCDAGITPSALKAMHALYDLSINTYSSVRILAQVRLYWMLSHYPYSYRALIPRLASLLKEGGEGEEWHARHKGALFIMLGARGGPLVAKQDWEVLRTLWPAILKAPISEKPSIIRLEQSFSENLHRHLPTVNTRLTISQSAVDAARNILKEEHFKDVRFTELFNNAVERELANSDKTETFYKELIDEIVDVAETPNVQWRRLEIAMQLLPNCPLTQTPYPPRAVHLMARSLIHDNITVRKIAQRLMHFALKQRKRPLKKIMVDPYEIAGIEKPKKLIPGYRKDLEWAMWSKNQVPMTDEEWDKPWLRNPTYGFYGWPEKLEVAASTNEQVYAKDIKPEDMEEGERHIYEFFSKDENVDKLVAFLTVEEKKGKDKFNGIRFSVFRMLFAQFGERIADKFLVHAQRCAADTQEAPQRFAAEVAAAALRAPRYWPRERALAMYKRACLIIAAGLTTVTPETLDDWGTCVATGAEKMDPWRGGEVLDSLVNLCVPPPADDDHVEQDTSFVICARLFALQGALGSLTWRVAPLSAEILKRLEAANFIHHPYQNVRENVGSLLITLFDTEVVFPGGETGSAPKLSEFLDSVLPRLSPLYDENGDIMIKTTMSMSPVRCGTHERDASIPTELSVPLVPPVGQSGQMTVDVGQLSPDGPVAEDASQAADSTDPTDEPEVGIKVAHDQLEKQLVARLDTTLRLAGDDGSSQPRDHARALNLLSTVFRGCIGVTIRGLHVSTVSQYAMVKTACALAARGPLQPHDEPARAAAAYLASLALATHNTQAFDSAMSILEELSTGRSWWTRLACLDFAQPLLFYGLPLLCEQADRAVRAETFASKLMRDPRVEVRQLAAKLLTGLMHCRALPDEESTLRALKKSCRSKELVERHCGVLGLCSYLASRPYSLGPKLGDVLTELSRHTSAPDPIPATIRTALADFRRTHQDDWAKHRDQLTEEELDLLADLTSPPTYCA